MQVDFERQGDRLIARLSGELDHHAAAPLREKIDEAVMRERCRGLTLDLGGLGFTDSSGVGLIMGRYRLMRSLGGDFAVRGAGGTMERMLRLAGLDKLPIWEENERRSSQ